MLYQEILHALQTAPNRYSYDKDLVMTYRLGYFAEGGHVPTIISLHDEAQGARVVEYFGNNNDAVKLDDDGLDVIVVPSSQVAPSGACGVPRIAQKERG